MLLWKVKLQRKHGRRNETVVNKRKGTDLQKMNQFNEKGKGKTAGKDQRGKKKVKGKVRKGYAKDQGECERSKGMPTRHGKAKGKDKGEKRKEISKRESRNSWEKTLVSGKFRQMGVKRIIHVVLYFSDVCLDYIQQVPPHRMYYYLLIC
jgi:hypothetical protein